MLNAIYLIIVRHLLERRVRTAITVVGVALGVAVSIAIRTANVEALKTFEETVVAVAGRATLQISGGELGLDERVIEQVRHHPFVTLAAPVIQVGMKVSAGPHRGKTFVVMAVDLLDALDTKGFGINAGSERRVEDLLSTNALFVGRGLASEWGLEIGAPLDVVVGVQQHRVVIRGMVDSEVGRQAVWEHMGIMDIAAAQARFGLVGRLDRIDLVTEPGESIDRIADDLRAWLPPPLTVSRPSRRNEQVERMVRSFQLNLTMLSAVGLLVGLLLVYNTISFSVVQRRRQIGMLRALGMRRGLVSAIFMGEAALMGAIGGLIGSALGVMLARGLVPLVSRTISDLYVPLATVQGAVGDSLAGLFSMPLEVWLQGTGLGMVVSGVAALGPSLDASRTAPAKALSPGDYESGLTVRTGVLARAGLVLLVLSGFLAWPGPVMGMPVFGYASILCMLIGLSLLTPALVRGFGLLSFPAPNAVVFSSPAVGRQAALARLAVDQVARAPGRNAVTISAMMVGIAIMVGVGAMIGSFRHTVELWIEQTVLADLIVAPPSWPHGDDSGMLANRLPLSWVETLVSIPGVAAIDTYRELTVELQGQPVALVSRDLALHAERSRYLFLSGDSRTTLEQTRDRNGVIVSEVLARTYGLRPGTTLSLMTPAGEQSFPILGVFYDYATDGGKVVMDRARYRQLWRDDTATVLAVYLTTGAGEKHVRQEIIRRLAEAEGESHPIVISNAELRREILAIFDRTFRVTYALEFIAVVIAVLGIVNTVLTSVLERRRELATLRSIGASAPQLQTLMLWESGYLGLLGGATGVVGGVLLSLLLIEVINKQSFGWTIQFTLAPALLINAVGVALAAALLAGFLPARWASRQPVVDGLRYE